MLLSLLFTAGLAACAAVPSTTACVPQIGGGITEEGVVNNNCCAELTVIFARGTLELGNLGGIIGPPLLAALRASLGASKVLGQGVDYPASLEVRRATSVDVPR
jgi:Cutinase